MDSWRLCDIKSLWLNWTFCHETSTFQHIAHFLEKFLSLWAIRRHKIFISLLGKPRMWPVSLVHIETRIRGEMISLVCAAPEPELRSPRLLSLQLSQRVCVNTWLRMEGLFWDVSCYWTLSFLPRVRTKSEQKAAEQTNKCCREQENSMGARSPADVSRSTPSKCLWRVGISQSSLLRTDHHCCDLFTLAFHFFPSTCIVHTVSSNSSWFSSKLGN